MHNITKVTICLSVFAMLLTTMIGCSDSQHPISPEFDKPEIIADSSNGNHQLYGAWIAEFDPQSNSVEIIPDRNTYTHYNISAMIPPPVITVNSYNSTDKIMDVDITIQNPYAFDAYDLRLIVYTDTIGHTLLNNDDWTGMFDIAGGEIINPFKAYATTEPSRLFAGLTNHTENLQILMPDDNFIVSFAIDASFPGNCLEPYEIDVFSLGELTEVTGSTTDAILHVHDWQSDVSSVYLYCPAIIAGDILPFIHIDTYVWTAILTNDTGASEGEYTGYLATYSSSSGSLALYDKIVITVNAYSEYWAKTWGGVESDLATSISTDSNDDVYITGVFEQTVDFGDGNPITSNGDSDNYLLKLDSLGNFEWVRTWGGFGGENVYTVTTDNNDDLYICGRYAATVDFGDGIPITSIGSLDAYLLKLNSKGDFLWVKTWGGSGFDNAHSAAIDINGDVFVTCRFADSVDFGDGIPITSNGSSDASLLKLDSDGVFIWVKTWGGTGTEIAYSVAMDNNRDVFVSGSFGASVDFGNGTPISSKGSQDGYLLKLDINGSFEWVNTWGGDSSEEGYSFTLDSIGDAYVTGGFHNRVDFGDGNLIRSKGARDAYLLKINSIGNFVWVNTWGGTGSEMGNCVTTDSNNDAYVIGGFMVTVDFGDGNPIECNGGIDYYLSKFNSTGDFDWVKTWGGTIYDQGMSVKIDNNGDLYTCGYFMETIDFGDGNLKTTNGAEDSFIHKFAVE